MDFAFCDLSDPGEAERAITADTAMVWIETPTNPTLKIVDIAAVAAMAKKANPACLVVVDGTFTSPINQRPLDHGADIVMHSVTKYLNGHSDVVGGLLVTGDAELAGKIRFLQNAVGSVMGPFDAYLTLRGMKTLAVRIARHNENASRIASWLEGHEQVERVVYPGLASHASHAVYEKQRAEGGGAGGMITFFIAGGLAAARAFLERVRVFALAESLGGVESLIEHPAIMTHASVPADMRERLGISDTLIRLSVGIEDADDLIADLEAGFAAAAEAAGAASATA
jgi:cystathionine gamma-lyase